MTDAQNKIIIFKAYDTVMEANLAKTKLDAYGIPCFLTDENLTTLYPIRNAIFPGVRLFIFEEDSDEVKTILDEDQTTSGFIKCPRCGSHDFDAHLSPFDRGVFFLTGIFGMMTPSSSPSQYRCKSCGTIYDCQ